MYKTISFIKHLLKLSTKPLFKVVLNYLTQALKIEAAVIK